MAPQIVYSFGSVLIIYKHVSFEFPIWITSHQVFGFSIITYDYRCIVNI